MLLSPPFRFVLLLIAATSLLMALAAVRLYAQNEVDHVAQRTRVADLQRLQQATQAFFDAHALGEPARVAGMRQAQQEIAAIWQRHPDWGRAAEYAALKAGMAEFESALHQNAEGRIAQGLNRLLLAINAEMARTLDGVWQHEQQMRTDQAQKQSFFLFFAIWAVFWPLLAALCFAQALAARVSRIRLALGGDVPAGGDVFAGLLQAAQTLSAAHSRCRQEWQNMDAHARMQDAELSQTRCALELHLARWHQQQQICAECLWEWDIAADHMSFSPVWSQLLGYAETDAPQRMDGWLALIHPDDRPQAEAARLGFMSGNLPAFEMSLRFLHADGRWRTLYVRCRCVMLDGRMMLYGSHIDRSVELRLSSELESQRGALQTRHAELIQMRERMLRAAQLAALGKISSGISEEISTPLGIVLTAASSLDDESRQLQGVLHGGAIRRSDLDRYLRLAGDASRLILKHAERAADLARSFRHVAIDQITEEKRQFFIEAYFTEILLTLAPQFKNTPHCFLLDCADDPEIDSYPGVFTQIFTNLVGNALQHAFSPDQPGVLAIRANCPAENELLLVFSDNGCGIPDELHEKVFEPFHSGRKGLNHGGLGLAMTRKLVEDRLSGRVWIENTPGGGTSVMIRIPVDSNRSKA